MSSAIRETLSVGLEVGALVSPVVQSIIVATPIIGVIFKTFTSIYEIAKIENHNKKKCQRAAERCRGIETIIRICAHEYANLRKNAFTADHIEALERLCNEVKSLEKMVEKYSKQGKVRRILGGVSFHHEYDKINSNITDAINVLQADLGTVNLAQNRKILDYLEQSKIMDMMATLEALQDKTDQAEGNRVAMESRLLEEFGKNERALRTQGLKVDGLKLLMEKHRQLAESKSDRDKKIITTFLDSIQKNIDNS